MLGQSKISSFFKSQPMKRPLEDQQSCQSSPSKAMKTDGSSLSPEQKAAIQEKRQTALAKLASKTVPCGMGQSWKKALEPEFSKDYFKKVCIFEMFQIVICNTALDSLVSLLDCIVRLCRVYSPSLGLVA
jgi:hypothetical protein